MKTLEELMSQTVLDAQEARHLSELLGKPMSGPMFTHVCRNADVYGVKAEKRGRQWYVNRESWVRYVQTPTRPGRKFVSQ